MTYLSNRGYTMYLIKAVKNGKLETLFTEKTEAEALAKLKSIKLEHLRKGYEYFRIDKET